MSCPATPTLQLGGKWTCKLDGVEERQPFKSEQLHATAPPPSDTTLTAFQPKVLDAKLPVGDIAAFISNLQLDPDQPVELRRLHPESGTMLDLMTRTLLPSELDDDMLRRLRYKAAGAATRELGRAPVQHSCMLSPALQAVMQQTGMDATCAAVRSCGLWGRQQSSTHHTGLLTMPLLPPGSPTLCRASSGALQQGWGVVR